MRNKKILALGLSIALVAIAPASHAKKIFPSEIMGRDLNYPGKPWIGNGFLRKLLENGVYLYK